MNSLRIVFKVFYSEQAFWDFLVTCSTFSVVCEKKWFTKKLIFYYIEKEYEKINL